MTGEAGWGIIPVRCKDSRARPASGVPDLRNSKGKSLPGHARYDTIACAWGNKRPRSLKIEEEATG